MIDTRDVFFLIVAAALMLGSARSSPLPAPAVVWQALSYSFACQNMTLPDCTEPLPSL